MNSITAAPARATKKIVNIAQAQPAHPMNFGRQPPASITSTCETADDPSSWREQVRDMLPKLLEQLRNANDIKALDSTENGSVARALIWHGIKLLERAMPTLRAGSVDDYKTTAYDVHAFLIAAINLDDTAAGLPEILEPVARTMDRIATLVDEASIQPEAPPQPSGEHEQQAFMAGKTLFCNVMTAVAANRDATWLDAAYRYPGVPIDVSAISEALDTIARQPELRHGFCAAATGFLNSAVDSGIISLTARVIQELSHDQCGAGTGEQCDPSQIEERRDIDSRQQAHAPFLAGVALCADMIQVAIDLDAAGDDECDAASLWACVRGRGVQQRSFAAEFLNKITAQPELLEGFAAALSSHLVATGNGGEDPYQLKNFTERDHVGGPDTMYLEEEVEVAPGEEWRRDVDKLLRKCNGTLTDALSVEGLEWGNGPSASMLLRQATEKLDAVIRRVYVDPADQLLGEVNDLQAFTVGAHSMNQVPGTFYSHTKAALFALAKVVEILDMPAPAAPAAAFGDMPDEPVFTDPAEIKLNDVIQRLDAWIDLTEHYDGEADAAFDLMHSEVWGPFYAAQQALYRHDPQTSVLQLMNVGAGLRKVLAAICETDGRWPLIFQSLQLLNALLDDGGDAAARMEFARQTPMPAALPKAAFVHDEAVHH